MQYRIYNRKTLEYRAGGYVVSYNIDDDYIVNNNSTISIVKPQNDKNFLNNVVVGDIIALIQDSGAFHKGVITAVDSTSSEISYKSDKELFNDNMLNPLRNADAFMDDDDSTTVAGKFGVEIVSKILEANFAEDKDSRRKDTLKTLPLVFQANGDVLDENGEPKMLWTWADDSINIADWLTQLFEKYNLTLSWNIDFNMAEGTLANRKPKYIVTLSAITNSGNIIKDNVDMQTITYTTRELPESTVCYVIDSESKELLTATQQKNLIQSYNTASKASLQIGHYVINNVIQSLQFNTPKNVEDSDTSSYLALEDDQDYTLTFYSNPDKKVRFIFAYDEKKKALGAYTYNVVGINTSMILSKNSIINKFNSANANRVGSQENTSGIYLNYNPNDPPYEDMKAAIKYIKICFEHNAKVQFEKGNKSTPYEDIVPAVYYLYEKSNNEYDITTDKENKDRVLPVKTTVVSYNTSSDSDTTPEDVAKEKLIPSKFNQAIEIRINSDSKMFDFANAQFGDLYKIINEQGTIDSIFTGKKITSKDKYVTLYFGLGRQNYTDLIQIRLRKQRYTEVYNMGGL